MSSSFHVFVILFFGLFLQERLVDIRIASVVQSTYLDCSLCSCSVAIAAVTYQQLVQQLVTFVVEMYEMSEDE